MLYFIKEKSKEGEIMFTGFNLQLNESEKKCLSTYEAKGNQLFQDQQNQIRKTLDALTYPSNVLRI